MLIRLLRPQQWFKNVFVFLPLIYSGNALTVTLWPAAILTFIAFCALSSATYVINDLRDRHADRINPEKKHRPLASGKISLQTAILLATSTTLLGLALAVFLPPGTLACALAYFVFSQLYTLWIKHEPFADVILLSANFVLRAIAGAFAIGVFVSPWLITCVFFLALFLFLGKRHGELLYLRTRASAHRKTLATYTPAIISSLSTIATAALVISYTAYALFGRAEFALTLPFALYTIFRYHHFIASGNIIARHPERVFLDKKMVFAMLLWGMSTLTIIYLFPK